MSDQRVPTERTPVDVTALYLALRLASRAFGAELSRNSLLVLMAHSDFETGTWSACNNYNLAGIKHVDGDGHDFAAYLTREVIGGQAITVVQNFRAYATLEEGVSDYLHVIRGRFGYAWPAVEAGDVQDFAHRLKARGYFTANEQEYAAGLAARRAMLDARIAPDTLPEPLEVSRAEPLNLEAEEVGGEGPPDAA